MTAKTVRIAAACGASDSGTDRGASDATWTCGPGRSGSSTASSAPAKRPSPPEACPQRRAPPPGHGHHRLPGPPGPPGPPNPDYRSPRHRRHSHRPREQHSPPASPAPARSRSPAPSPASTVRKIACDADIIPVLLGSEGRILDIGRTTRIFPPHIRKAITARDQGCAFPGCTIPAPWCEAHHITYWSHGGPTSTDNGTLLCSHHHHLIHKEQWPIQVKTGVPWFIPPPHIDPRQKPQQNNYFKT